MSHSPESQKHQEPKKFTDQLWDFAKVGAVAVFALVGLHDVLSGVAHGNIPRRH